MDAHVIIIIFDDDTPEKLHPDKISKRHLDYLAYIYVYIKKTNKKKTM